jgi:hypothetical protein
MILLFIEKSFRQFVVGRYLPPAICDFNLRGRATGHFKIKE